MNPFFLPLFLTVLTQCERVKPLANPLTLSQNGIKGQPQGENSPIFCHFGGLNQLQTLRKMAL